MAENVVGTLEDKRVMRCFIGEWRVMARYTEVAHYFVFGNQNK
jgi:hypothetical protein